MSSELMPLGDGSSLQVQKFSLFLPDSLGTSSRTPSLVCLEGSQTLQELPLIWALVPLCLLFLSQARTLHSAVCSIRA